MPQLPIDIPLDLGRMSQRWVPSKECKLKYKGQVQERLRLLYTELRLAIDILSEIQDSVRELEQLREELE